MITLRIEEILKERGISKTQFAEMMGVKKQNVNLLIETNNIRKIEEIAEKLNLKFSDLITETDTTTQPIVCGYIEFKREIVKISSVSDIEMLLEKIKATNKA
jgi:DNA-binding Xre family transcriptional regulator